ncbi:unnamed protein product [Choristocarpus tenellus]
MASARLQRTPTKRWVSDKEVSQCPLCKRRFEGNFLDITLSGRTHCRYCGGVFCTSCCTKELYMPEDEVVRPPTTDRLKSIIFDPTDKQKACNQCALILIPQQEAIKASRNRVLRNNFTSRKAPAGPYFNIVVVQGKGLVGTPSKRSSGITDPVCLLTVGNTSSITQPTQSSSSPVWDQSFDFPVGSEHGNILKLTCYEEQQQGKELIGEGSVRVTDTGPSGVWVAVTDDRKVVTGQVLVRCTYRGPRSSKPTHTRSVPSLGSFAEDIETDLQVMPALQWLQGNAWVIYVVFLGLTVVYRIVYSGGFSGDPIPFRAGTIVGNNKWLRSSTHFLHLQKDGNLVLHEGRPSTPRRGGPVWESGRPFEEKDCLKCIASIDKDGDVLTVKDGRKVLKSFVVEEDKWLRSALAIR